MVIDLNQLKLVHNAELNQFEMALADDQYAVVSYHQGEDNTLVLTHTRVPPEFEGQGVGSKLARTVLEYARENGLRVVPMCSFIAAYIRSHSEYEPLTRKQD